MKALYRLYSAYPLLLRWKRRGAAAPAAPGDPTGFTATAQESAVLLSWDSQPEADTFEILYSTSNVFGTAVSLASGITGTSFTHDSGESIQVGEKYYYWIQATNGVGTSGYAGSVTARSYATIANTVTRNLTTPNDNTWTLSTLFFGAGGNLPDNCIVTFGSDIAIAMGDGTWYDVNNDVLFNPSIEGAFSFDNQTGSSVTIWNGEP